ncbi:TonB-dependent receptor plug domain-containing protein [Spirosoma sp. KNUC1025]|uniref:TonB-dependent receptor plug domain-containing protein n=1 Tax=Spirosoma sp. KNUC1025 TaxID=2894082 RepID=UPI0038700C48
MASTGLGKSFVKSAATDEQGRFRLAGMAIADTIQLLTRITDRQSRTLPTNYAFWIQEGIGNGWDTSQLMVALNGSGLRTQLEAARLRQAANPDLYRDQTAKALNEVTVRAQKYEDRPADIQQRSLHNAADAVVKFDEKSPSYSNLYEMMQGRLAGVTVSRSIAAPGGVKKGDYVVSMRGGNSFLGGTQPLYLMDGVPIQDPDGNVLMFFNPRDIERIEVLKSAGAAGIYGSRGGNGVIAFYTKRTRSLQGNTKSEENMTRIQFIGYPSVQREFYVPRYEAEAITSPVSGPVDHRDVLYWKPHMQTDSQGRSQLRFPLSDVVRTLRVVIQGVTVDGRPVLGVQLVRVQ